MRVLLAGGTGVLGRPAVARLVAAEHDVVAVSRREESDALLRRAGATPVRLDVFDPAVVAGVTQDVDAVVNLATHIPPQPAALRLRAWQTNDRLRRDASRVLADAAIDAGARFVQESFAPTYADRGADWVTEADPLEPVAQTRTVADAEASADRVVAAGLPAVVLRFGMLYGRGIEAVGDWIASAEKGRFFLPGPLGRYTSMVDVDDAAAAVETALSLPAGRYNVVEDDPVTIGRHAEVLAALVGRERLKPVPATLGRLRTVQVLTRSLRVSNARLRSVSGWRSTVPNVSEGWRRILEPRVSGA